MQLTLTIKGTAARAIRDLEQLPPKIDQALKTGLTRGLEYAVGVAKLKYLSGPRPSKLDIRTRRLRDSIVQEVESSPGVVKGRVGTNVKYAAYHEFGFHGTVNVQAHSRVMRQAVEVGRSGEFEKDVEFVDTRRTTKSKSGEVYRETRKQAASRQRTGFVGVGFVRGHGRRIDYAGRPFVRPAVEDSMPAIEGQINLELRKTAESGS